MAPRTQLTQMAIVVMFVMASSWAHAGSRHSSHVDRRPHDPSWTSSRQEQPKDCTRIVGRYGYYANPWCNAAEQRRWDLWETRKRR